MSRGHLIYISFATSTTKQTKLSQKNEAVMRMSITTRNAIITLAQSNWIRPAVMLLALVAVLGATVCMMLPH